MAGTTGTAMRRLVAFVIILQLVGHVGAHHTR